MFADSIEIELTELVSGTSATLKVAPLTLAMKNNLDEWLRFRALKHAVQNEGCSLKEAEELVDDLDIFTSNWFLPETAYLPRVLWEVSGKCGTYNSFVSKYFDIEMRSMTYDNDAKTRFHENMENASEAVKFALRNPTQPEIREAVEDKG